MYTILLKDDKSLIATKRETIIQYSNLVDKIRFLIPPTIAENDMTEYATVLLQYISPTSKKLHTEFLTLSDEKYNDHLQYVLPVNTKMTIEAGNVELQLTLYKNNLTVDGEVEQFVMQTTPCCIKILPVASWTTAVTDETLAPLDAKIQELMALEKEIETVQSQIAEFQVSIIDDENISGTSTYSSKKIEEKFLDIDEVTNEIDDRAINESDIDTLYEGYDIALAERLSNEEIDMLFEN